MAITYDDIAPAILVEADGPVRIVTLNKPDQLNAMSDDLHEAIRLVWDALDDDADARSVVLTGAGRAFSSGGYMPNFVRNYEDPVARERDIHHAELIARAMIDCRLPIVAAVNGPAVGLGCSLATMCDIVLISERAFMCDPHVNVGLTAADGGVVTWPLHMGLLQAKEYLLLGERIPAEQCVQLGLATKVVKPEELQDLALDYARRLAAQPVQALQTTKRALNLHMRASADRVLPYALASELTSFATDDVRRIAEEFTSK
jgi:enoyl-CoA hydratase